MKLGAISVENVRGVPDGTYVLVDPKGSPLDVAIVTGAPRSGRTSLLEAIAAAKEATGSYGAPIPSVRLLRKGAARGRIVTTWILNEAEKARAALDEAQHVVTWELDGQTVRADADPRLRRLFAEFSRDPEYGKLEYFPANRSLRAQRLAGPMAGTSSASEARLRATGDPEKYATIASALHDLGTQDAQALARVLAARGVALLTSAPDSRGTFREAVGTMVPALRLADVELRDGAPVLTFLRRNGTVFALDELSDGEAQGVLFALAFRYFGLNHSIVLIDEPELHIHAAERVDFLQALVRLGSNNQLIVATGSAEIVNAAAPVQKIDLSRAVGAPARVLT